MEDLVRYVWKHRLFPLTPLLTTDGQEVEVIHPGMENRSDGPDFFNAKVKIAGTLWVGNVEIHGKASDWLLHGHDTNKRYDSVVLHVAGMVDREIVRTDGTPIPQLELKVPEHIINNYAELRKTDHYPPCYRVIPELGNIVIHSFLSSLLYERLDMRSTQIAQRYEAHDKNWDDALFSTIARNFGFGTNGDAFDEWARRMPFRAVDKHADNLQQIEALFFGQAGLLEEDSVPTYYKEALASDGYFQTLRREYAFLAHKFDLRPMDYTTWRLLGMRPANFPHVRLAQLAMLYHERRISVSKLLAATDKSSLTELLRVGTSPYWDTHYTFASTPSAPTKKRVTDNAVTLLLINSVAPFYYSYGRRKDSEQHCEQAVALLEQLKAENNYIIRGWIDCGLIVKHAADSQALIQLKKQYCDRRDCLRCRIGYEYLKKEYGVKG
ncbi:MAG: DUF2851 family protein [Bacteroidaceae bacterium]|nr:DUF2851 family protein [Bacteroidaceae bacterium]